MAQRHSNHSIFAPISDPVLTPSRWFFRQSEPSLSSPVMLRLQNRNLFMCLEGSACDLGLGVTIPSQLLLFHAHLSNVEQPTRTSKQTLYLDTAMTVQVVEYE